jgi:membrane-associated phospholipid phosphatase
MIPFARAVTELGEPALLIPLCALLCACMTVRSRGWALRWTGAFVACAAGIAALKLCFLACPQRSPWLHSPSGHAALSALFFPSLAWFVTADARRGIRAATLALGVLAAATVAASRAVLLTHSWSEVMAGGLVGLAAFAAFARARRPSDRHQERRAPEVAVAAAPPRQGTWLLMVGLLALTWASYGERLPFQDLLMSKTAAVRLTVAACR